MIPNFVGDFGSVSRLVSGSHDTINVASTEEERVGNFIQKPSMLGLYLCNFLGSVNEKYSYAFLRFIMVFHVEFVFPVCIIFICVRFC